MKPIDLTYLRLQRIKRSSKIATQNLTMIFRRWGSLMVTIGLLLSVGILLKRYDFEVVNQVKAFLTVMLGLATSFLILSFIWLLHRKPLHSNWAGFSNGESPSMHPMGRTGSINSIGYEQRRPCTVSSIMDKPPDYEDALINSKPINWQYLPSEKSNYSYLSESTSNQVGSCLCLGHSGEHAAQTTSGDCRICTDETAQDKFTGKNFSAGNSVAQLALTFVRGFTTSDISNPNQQVSSNAQNSRKVSYSQLDASQLMISGSPPKYSGLVLSGMIVEDLSNNSNEPRAC